MGRKFEDDVVKKHTQNVPYKVVRADNGDAWVEARGKKMAPPEISARILQKMKKQPRIILANRLQKRLLQYRPISMTHNAKPPRTLVGLRDLR